MPSIVGSMVRIHLNFKTGPRLKKPGKRWENKSSNTSRCLCGQEANHAFAKGPASHCWPMSCSILSNPKR